MALLRAFPDDEWRNLRVAVFVLGSLALMVVASGVVASRVFHQPTTLKYLVTVAACALIIVLAMVKAPLKLLVGLAILAGPINSVVTFQGASVTPLLAIDLLAVIVALPRLAASRSALRPIPAVFALLLLSGIAQANSPSTWITWLAVTLATGWVAFEVAREPGGISFVAGMLVLSGLIQGAITIWEFKTKHQLYLYSAAGTRTTGAGYFFTFGNLFRPSGTLPDPIGLGQVLALCLPISLAFAASVRRFTAAFIVSCAAGIMALALALSLSRMSIVGGAAGLLATLVLLPGFRRRRMALNVTVVGIVVVALAMALGGQTLSTRLTSILNPTSSHVHNAAEDITRVQIWHAALRVGEAHAVTGVGLGRVTDYLPRYGVPVTALGNAQNTFLQVFAEAGALGLIALLALILAAFTDLAKAFREQRLWAAGCVGALVATLVTWATDVEVRYVQVSGMVAILIGLIAALRVTSARSERPS